MISAIRSTAASQIRTIRQYYLFGPPDVIKQHIVEATDEDTRVSTMFTGKTLRSIYSRFHDAWDESGLTALPFPLQIMISSALLAGFIQANVDDYIGGFAGQASGMIKEIKPAREILEDMVEEAADILIGLSERVTAE